MQRWIEAGQDGPELQMVDQFSDVRTIARCACISPLSKIARMRVHRRRYKLAVPRLSVDVGDDCASSVFRHVDVCAVRHLNIAGFVEDAVNFLNRVAGLADGGSLSLDRFVLTEDAEAEDSSGSSGRSSTSLSARWVEALTCCIDSLATSSMQQLRLDLRRRLGPGDAERLSSVMVGCSGLQEIEFLHPQGDHVASCLRHHGWQVESCGRRGWVARRMPTGGLGNDAVPCIVAVSSREAAASSQACAASLIREWDNNVYRPDVPATIPHMVMSYTKLGVVSAPSTVAWPILYEPASQCYIVKCSLVHVDFNMLCQLKQLPPQAYDRINMMVAHGARISFFLNVNRRANPSNVMLGAPHMAIADTGLDAVTMNPTYQVYYHHLCGQMPFPKKCDGSCGNQTGDDKHCEGMWWPYNSADVSYVSLSEHLGR